MALNWLILVAVLLLCLALLSFVMIYSPSGRKNLHKKINRNYRSLDSRTENGFAEDGNGSFMPAKHKRR